MFSIVESHISAFPDIVFYNDIVRFYIDVDARVVQFPFGFVWAGAPKFIPQ